MDFDRYSTSAFAYWSRSRGLLNEFEQSRHKLFYSAYELRCAIESFLYDYLYFLHDEQLTKTLEKLYLANNLKNAIREKEPDFEQRIAFNNLIHSAMGLDVVNILPELNGDAQWERIINDPRPRPALTALGDELAAKYSRTPAPVS